jgi:hypothetical protein
MFAAVRTWNLTMVMFWHHNTRNKLWGVNLKEHILSVKSLVNSSTTDVSHISFPAVVTERRLNSLFRISNQDSFSKALSVHLIY